MQRAARVLYDFTPSSADELALRAGQVVLLSDRDPDGWWMGVVDAGRSGLVPENYVEFLADGQSQAEERLQEYASQNGRVRAAEDALADDSNALNELIKKRVALDDQIARTKDRIYQKIEASHMVHDAEALRRMRESVLALRDVNSQLKKASLDRHSQQGELNELKGQVDAQQRRVDDLRATKSQLEDNIDQLRQQLERSKTPSAQQAQLEAQIASLRRDIAAQHLEKQRLVALDDQLRRDLAVVKASSPGTRVTISATPGSGGRPTDASKEEAYWNKQADHSSSSSRRPPARKAPTPGGR